MGRNIVLIGMPGAGKSTLGVVLAKIMNYDFLDVDLVIQQQCDKTLQRLIDTCGPEGFLQVEGEVLKGLDCTGTVISTGGSAVYSEEGMAHLRDIGLVAYLRVGYDALSERLSDFSERGVVMRDGMGMSLRDLFEERRPLYERHAQVVVDVDGLSITEAARQAADAIAAALDG